MSTTRDRHYRNLSGYRASREYADHARAVGMEIAEGDRIERPALLGVRWSITEEIYNDFLGMLPPMRFTGRSFLICKFCFGSITTKYTREGDRYFCEFVDAKAGRS